MKHFPSRLPAAFACLLVWSAGARADLNTDIKTVLMNGLLQRAEVGIQVVRLGAQPGDDRILFRHNSDIPLVPASNLKLITTSAALEALGSEFRFRTLLVKHGEDLVLIGDGDPTLGDAELLRKSGWDVTTLFRNWGEALHKRGLESVNNVLVDDSVFDLNFAHRHWPVDQLHKRYVAEVAGVNLNANCVDFYLRTSGAGRYVEYVMSPATHYVNVRNTCVSGGDNAVWLSRQAGGNDIVLRGTCPVSNDVPISVTVHDPAMFATAVLAENLVASGIKVRGRVDRDRTARAQLPPPPTPPATTTAATKPAESAWALLAVHETPLTQVMARANKDSMNLYAECLCKRLGVAASGQSGSWDNGVAAVGAFLKKVGVDENEFHLDDGCGLSKENAISANAICRVLMFNHHGASRAVFLGSLSVAGSDGTLEKRFEGSDLRGRVFGKSGFVNGVSALSGYLKGKDEQWYAFSILMNGIAAGSNSSAKPLQEAIVRAIDVSTSGKVATTRE